MLAKLVKCSTSSGPLPAVVVFVLCALFARPLLASEAGQYLSVGDFLSAAFDGEQPQAKVYWLPAPLKQEIRRLTGRDFPLLRVRYWQQGARSAWILDEIGKEMPITIGVVVERQAIRRVDILAFRESRGWEVRHPFFTRQYVGAGLNEQRALNRHVDGITGATLSVRAVTHVARLALLLAREALPPQPEGAAP